MPMKESDKKALMFLAVVGAGALIYLYVLPMFDEHDQKLQEIDGLVRELRLAHKKAENMSALVGEVDVLRYRLAELKKVLPTEAGSFELIEKLQNVANFSGVKIRGISIENRTEKGEGWTAVGFRIEGSCHWYQFIQFLWQLENFERLIDVVTISINPLTLMPGEKIQKFDVVLTANVYSSTLTES